MDKPKVELVEYSPKGVDEISKMNYILNDFPTVYIVFDKADQDKYFVYVGEANDVKRRTREHFNQDRDDWDKFKNSISSKMYVIGHEHFNKSMTLDIENKFMNMFMGVPSIKDNGGITNRRTNPQNKYYPKDEMNDIFDDIWKQLHKKNPDLFPETDIIRSSALFKSSPFHELNTQQLEAKNIIEMKIEEDLLKNNKSHLILVEGAAGTGKTVLLSSVFFGLINKYKNDFGESLSDDINVHLVVNHNEQKIVYENIANKLGIDNVTKIISKPNSFIKTHEYILEHPEKKVDVIIVDEGHLLATRNGQAFPKKIGKTHIDVLQKMAKVVLLVFDPKQILTAEQYVDSTFIDELITEAHDRNDLIRLDNQMRMDASETTVRWLKELTDNHIIGKFKQDGKYDLKILDTPDELYKEIKSKAKTNKEAGLSRMLATYDWEWKQDGDEHLVSIGDFSMPWNYYFDSTKKSSIPWAENEKSLEEIGSTFTIQGFDLNYAGVIIGPTFIYRDGKIQVDMTKSKSKKAVQRSNGESAVIQNLYNELNVLLTRGVHGLYIYAVDSELQNALKESINGNN
ncbi:DUF2075 domain-containing protein [Weissella koreensis]|uniref:DUF2075 domain-containing protein n=1 Tax=Weissella koreensis TaxID=165096 RepID=UPI000CF31650|nr:DUF2075 domain-containing protein [Weissella koreensis]AVH74702.1 ATP-dependent exonuclease [Weissella koreensis]QGN19925.1 DUF2075 domain-containing protein [Weissella koreensis]